jgi:predicted metalloprotease
MRWEGNRESENVEDARASGGGFRLGGGSLGLGSVVIAVVAGWIFGINPLTILGLMSGGGNGTVAQAPAQKPPADDPMARFVSVVLADTEDVWTTKFRAAGSTYRVPKLVLFRGSYPTACGTGQAAMGPFYCPNDEKVYIDLSFYEVMKSRLGAPGDFAQAYVIAHEVGHHVQKLMGLTDRVENLRGRQSEAQQNAISVRLELQADCFAGAWAQHASMAGSLSEGNLDEGATALFHAGNSKIPWFDPAAHGTPEQRVNSFVDGFAGGPGACIK